MFEFLKVLRVQIHVTNTAERMLREAACPWTTSVGMKITRTLLSDLACDNRSDLYKHWCNHRRSYPTPLLDIASVIELGYLILRKAPEARDLAEELLLVSIIALHESYTAEPPEITQALASRIDAIARAYAPALYNDRCPIELNSSSEIPQAFSSSF